MRHDELLDALTRLKTAPVGGRRAPHKPLLLLWLFGRYVATGSSAVAYADAEEPVSRLINDFGPSVVSASAQRQRAAMPFVHLERTLWQLLDDSERPIGPEVRESGNLLRSRGAIGRLRPEVELLLADPGTLAAAVRVLLDRHFTPALEPLICGGAGLDLTSLEDAARSLPPRVPRARTRRSGFAEEALRAYAFACAMCGYDGALGRNPVGLEAAHVRWHSQHGPDELRNALALCALHHALLDLGVLGLTVDMRIRVSGLYVARNEAGRAVDALAGRRLAAPRPGNPSVDPAFVAWHDQQVFKHPAAA
ncbi:phosphorothioated DNA-binding restriction endonuclease [Streptantibioticus rubrisoli]|uniref:Restriction endonuclease n=1 Tax=Streptantibioticus rubrisoli TaxID=1387313 RepID=A0ABT1P5A3_9ACTN|nr:HNH endonuclease [Streptantibioticus rubrisoli]MCQ4040549.1 restriction endonuclease [Streptantibioticus rubrisoli]